jgi:hypothetical protein
MWIQSSLVGMEIRFGMKDAFGGSWTSLGTSSQPA